MAKKKQISAKQAQREWEALLASIAKSTSVDLSEGQDAIMRRRARLEANRHEWRKYYFEQYYTAEPAPFHIRTAKRFREARRLYEVRAWSRELAKTATAMMDVVEAVLIDGSVRNALYISNSYDNAERLLDPIRAQFEANQRIIQDYGEQVTLGKWEAGEFTTRSGCSFRALGAGQSPRGMRKENYRTDLIVFDDIDTDEEVLNADRIEKKWRWIERAVIPTTSVSGSYRILFLGNIIAKDCIIARAIAKAKTMEGVGYHEVINIRDKNGKSTWAKNSEEDIDTFLSMLSFAAGMAEFFNTPITSGEVFTSMVWGKCPPLREMEYLVIYGDPSPSNKKGGSFKAVVALGYHKGITYIIDARLERTTNATFVDYYYELRDQLPDNVQVYYYIENNTLQDPIWEQVILPTLREVGAERGMLPISPDGRKKPDKFSRIEGNLEPLNRNGLLIFNEARRDNPHMVRLEEQFTHITPRLPAPADGPDAVEGGWYKINELVMRNRSHGISVGSKRRNAKRY